MVVVILFVARFGNKDRDLGLTLDCSGDAHSPLRPTFAAHKFHDLPLFYGKAGEVPRDQFGRDHVRLFLEANCSVQTWFVNALLGRRKLGQVRQVGKDAGVAAVRFPVRARAAGAIQCSDAELFELGKSDVDMATESLEEFKRTILRWIVQD